MKKSAVAALLLLLTLASIFFNASAFWGSEMEYYQDATYTTMIGHRGTIECPYNWGILSKYRIVIPCP